MKTSRSALRALRCATVLSMAAAICVLPLRSFAEIQVSSSNSESVFSKWMNETGDRLYATVSVWIRAEACNGQPFRYFDYPVYKIVGCANSIDDGLAQVVAKMQSHLRSAAVYSGYDASGEVEYSTLVAFHSSTNVTVWGHLRKTSAAAPRNLPDATPSSCDAMVSPLAGNPVVVATGQKLQVDVDQAPMGPSRLSFVRFHNSAHDGDEGLGASWLHTFSRRLEMFPNDGAPTRAMVIRSSGKMVQFRLTGAVWTPDAADSSSLERLTNGWIYRSDANEIETYDAQGLLQSIVSAHGHAVRVARDGVGRVSTVEDSFGRSLRLRYGADGRVAQLQSSAGGAVGYVYRISNGLPTLARVTDANGASRTYLYEMSRLPALLTGLQDQNGALYAKWSYDDKGRALSSEHAGGAEKITLQFASGSTDVIDALGATRSLAYRTVNGVALLVSASQPAGSGCAASTRRWAHDIAGNVIEKDDFNQTRSCFAYDGRHLATRRVEGLSTAQSCAAALVDGATLPARARKSSRQWHPDWRLQTRRAEPGRIVTLVYNGQPDPFNGLALATCAPAEALLPDGKPIAVLCKQVVQASSDADGHLGFGASLQAAPGQVTRWTYNAFGQVLSATEQDSGGEVTTTYVYYADTTGEHTVGDLQSITTAAGEVTRFTAYNRHGQVLQRVDPDGSVTNNTYDAMQRLLRTTVDGEEVAFTYDPVGQLTRITDGEGAWVGYAYDDAHRQTAAFDHLGHRVDYRLDAAGNTIGRAVNDPDGTLARQLSRNIDLLGRVQQRAGRE